MRDSAGQRDTAGLDEDVIDGMGARRQVDQARDEIAAEAAADATASQRQDITVGAFDQVAVDRQRAEFVDSDRDAAATVVAQQMVD